LRLKQLVQYLDICDANMEEGSLRCDANVSVRPKSEKKLGTKTEVKNLNSFKNVVDALESEIKRQIEILQSGGKVVHQTLSYDAKLRKTSLMRSKEEAHDYRYFPEPDLVTVYVDENWKNAVFNSLPEFPEARMKRFVMQYSIPEYDAEVLTQDKSIADFFENICKSLKKSNFKAASNWMMTEVMRILNQDKIEITEFWVTEKNLASLINLIDDGVISNNIAKEVFAEMLKHKDSLSKAQSPEFIVKEKSLVQLSDSSEIEDIVIKILADYPDEVKRYKNGEAKLAGFFVGKIMKESKGKANPQKVNELLNKHLK